MTAYQLRSLYYLHNPHGHFFDADTLRFFGESMSAMRVLRETVGITDICGKAHTCYVLSKYSRKHPAGPRRTYAYFDIATYKEVIT